MIVCLVVWLFRGPVGRESRPLCSDVIFPFCTELVMMSEHDMQNRPDIITFSWSTRYRDQITSKGCACGPAERGTLRQAPETRKQRSSPAWAGWGRAPTWARRQPGSATGDGRWARAPCSWNKSGQFDERNKRDSSWRPERWTGSVRWWSGLESESRLEKVKENSTW